MAEILQKFVGILVETTTLRGYFEISICTFRFNGEMVGKVDTGLGRGHRFSITTVQTLAVIAHLSLFYCIVSSLT